MAAMEFAALMIQGKLPPLLAADDSSQILDCCLGPQRDPRWEELLTKSEAFKYSLQTKPCPIGWRQECVFNGYQFQPLKIAGVHGHDRDHWV